jgi:hypothetical protein
MRPFRRTTLTRLGVFTAHPASFVIVAVYVAAWLVIDPASFDWHAVATIATWFMRSPPTLAPAKGISAG